VLNELPAASPTHQQKEKILKGCKQGYNVEGRRRYGKKEKKD